MNWATDFNRNSEPEITEHWTAFPQFVEHSELRIILTGTRGSPGMLTLQQLCKFTKRSSFLV